MRLDNLALGVKLIRFSTFQRIIFPVHGQLQIFILDELADEFLLDELDEGDQGAAEKLVLTATKLLVALLARLTIERAVVRHFLSAIAVNEFPVAKVVDNEEVESVQVVDLLCLLEELLLSGLVDISDHGVLDEHLRRVVVEQCLLQVYALFEQGEEGLVEEGLGLEAEVVGPTAD